MSHAVHYRDAAGDVHLEDRPSLDAALELVESLQNEAGATEVRVFREVPIEVKTYYRVVAVDAGSDNGVAAQPVAQVVEPQAAQNVEPEAAQDVEPEAAHVVEPQAAQDAAPAAETVDAPVEPPAVVAQAPRLAPVEPPSGATIMSPPPASIAPVESTDEDHDGEPRAEHRRQLFSRG